MPKNKKKIIRKNKSPNYLPLVVLLSLLPLVILFAFIWQFLQPSLQSTSNNTKSLKTDSNEEYVYGKDEQYIKRQFDPSEKIFKIKSYPQEITDITEDKLISMRCSPYIWYRYESANYGYHTLNAKSKNGIVNVSDERWLRLIAEAQKNVPDSIIGDFRFCDTEDDRTIIQYGVHGGGGGTKNGANFGIMNANGTMQKITTIPNDGAPYFECRTPLQLTKSGFLYYGCGGGDGLIGAQSFYKIDITAKTHSSVMKCKSQGKFAEDNKPIPTPVITCK